MKRLLVVPTSKVGAAEIRSIVRTDFGDDVDVQVVAPASGISRLDWLTNQEDDVRAEAKARAEQIADELPTTHADGGVGDVDPLLAIDDAVRTFHPDEIVVVTRSDDDASWLEARTGEAARERFDVPVTHVVVP